MGDLVSPEVIRLLLGKGLSTSVLQITVIRTVF